MGTECMYDKLFTSEWEVQKDVLSPYEPQPGRAAGPAQHLAKLRLKFHRRRTTTFYKFIYQNDVRSRIRAALRPRKYLPSISWRGMKINCTWRVRRATDAEMDFSFDHPRAAA